MYIILNTEQATHVRGPTSEGAQLRPMTLLGGLTFALPTEVLDDPAHAMHREYLAALPQSAVVAWPLIDGVL